MSALVTLAQNTGGGGTGVALGGVAFICIFALIGLALVAFQIWMIIDAATSSLEPAMKIVWIIIILVFPLIGSLAYFFIARGKR